MISRNFFKKSVSTAIISAMLLGLVACGSKSVTGTWSAEQDGTKVTYVFNDDKTGSMDIGGGIILPITYEVDKDKLIVKYSMLGQEQNTEYQYTISKKKLTLTNGNASITLNQQ